MEAKLKREELDRLAEFYSLTPARVEIDAPGGGCAALARAGAALSRALPAIRGRVVARRGYRVLHRRELEPHRGLRPVRAARRSCSSRSSPSACWKPPPRFVGRARVVPGVRRDRRVAGAVRPDVSDRRGCLRAVPDLGVARPAAGDRRAVGRVVRGLGAGVQHRVAAVLRLAAARRIAVGDFRRRSDSMRPMRSSRAAAVNVALWIAAEHWRLAGRAGLGAPADPVLRLRLRHLGRAARRVGQQHLLRPGAARRSCDPAAPRSSPRW